MSRYVWADVLADVWQISAHLLISAHKNIEHLPFHI
jgi:hypothetical protein